MSAEEKIEEETYSLIFSSLKHPIRRRIMRMLVRGPRTFSEILEAVSIDSGHLNYHLENLGDLITHSPDGKYGLSSVGVAAVKLMSGVEENPPMKVSSGGKGMRTLAVFTKISLMILIVVLIVSSLFFIGFTQHYVDLSTKSGLGVVTISPNQNVEFNLTLVCNVTWPRVSGGSSSLLIAERQPWVHTITDWKEGFLRFTYSKFNMSYMTNVRVYDASGKMIEIGPIGGGGPGRGFVGFGTGLVITQPGTYITEFENIGSEPITGQIDYELWWERFERPYFYWGIVGLLITSIYPMLILTRWALTLHHLRHGLPKQEDINIQS